MVTNISQMLTGEGGSGDDREGRF